MSDLEESLSSDRLNQILTSQKILDPLRESYVLKAIEYISEQERTLSLAQEIILLFQEVVDINLHSQLLQLFEYLPTEQRTLLVMKTILHLFKKASYVHRSHVIKLITCIPSEQRTLELVQEMTIFFQQVATDWRYDIFRAIKNIPKEQRCEILDVVSKIIRGSEDWLFLAKRTAAIIEAIYRVDSQKRAEAFFCCQQYPIIFLQENIFSAICCFCPAIIET